MTEEHRQLVGDLSASEECNEPRHDGAEDVEGVSEAIDRLADTEGATLDTSAPSFTASGAEPYPGMLKDVAAARELTPIECPVSGCDYQHVTSQGLAGHFPNAAGGGHDWDTLDVSAVDLHELASRGTHPSAEIASLLAGSGSDRSNTTAAIHVERVRRWCEKNLPVPLAKLHVYVHPSSKRVEIEPREYLDSDDFTAYTETMKAASRIGFDPRRNLNYVEPSDVNRLTVSDSTVLTP